MTSKLNQHNLDAKKVFFNLTFFFMFNNVLIGIMFMTNLAIFGMIAILFNCYTLSDIEVLFT